MEDVLVIGGGNAALCAAISAAQLGARVLLLECAPKDFRGGNSRHTRNIRCMHDAPVDVLTDAYPESEYFEDLLRVTGGDTDEQLARLTIRSSSDVRAWMAAQGAHFQPALSGTLQLSRTNAFFLGGGKALMNAYYRAAERLGVRIIYEADVRKLEMSDGRFVAASYAQNAAMHRVEARVLVAAAGGFESNLRWLREAWGPAADNFLVRGTPYNMGWVLRELIDGGAQMIGDPTQCHAIAIDARSPKFDGGIVTRLDSITLGIVVNKHGQRFYDEGEDLWPKRYAIWGRLIAQQPDQIAYSIVDAKAQGKFMPSVFPPIVADSIAELAAKLDLDPEALAQTVHEYNAAVRPGTYDHKILDDCATSGIAPPKSHWARALDAAPFWGYPLRPGITFTYLGVKVNEHAQVLMQDDKPSPNVFAAGEIMAGNILRKGYLGGIGLTIGTAFGRIAGVGAARNVMA
ncbi:MAG TPA: FAD-dependent tricarballylate dehydrogenase TcuA [Candidatus Baltobacteraceae bacterium]|nr:FAD-dependent tricarballylate dehydrogenase TcuA [Candidatus Baltobacteraceae bacterium]